MDIWTILCITKTNDRNAIREAYMTQLAHCNPEDNPQGFQVLREAYETAAKLADETTEKTLDTSPVGLFMAHVTKLYDNFFQRINIEEWRDLLREDVVVQLDTEDEVSERLLSFLMDHHYLPHKVWQLLDNHFGWLGRSIELEQTFPAEYLGYIKNQVRFENLRYELFEYTEDANKTDYEKIVTQWHSVRRCLDSGEYAGIEELFEELAKINHPDFLLAKAELYRQRENYKDAHSILKPLLNDYPEHAGTLLEYATLLHHEALPLHNCEECETPCDKKVTMSLSEGSEVGVSPTERRGLGGSVPIDIENKNENQDEDRNDIDTEKLELSLSQYQKVLEIEPEYFSAKRGISECLIALQRYEEARELLYSILVEYPQSIYAMSGFGHVNFKLKELYTKKHKEDPTDVEVLINLVKFNLSLGDDDLEEAYKLLIANPQLSTHKRYPAFMGECLMHRLEYDEAIEYFKDALNREEFYRSYARLAAALIQNNNYDDALTYATIGINLPACFENDKSNKARLFMYKGNVFSHRGHFDEALEEYSQAEEIQPFLSRLHYDKAVIFKKLHRYAEAVDSCEYSLQLIPYDPDPYCLAMEMYYDANRYDDVLSWAERAENMDVEHSKITYFKACSLRLLNRESEALPLLLSLENIDYQSNDISKGLVLSEIAFIYWSDEHLNMLSTKDYIKRAIEYDSKAEYPYWRFLYMNVSLSLRFQEDILSSTTMVLSVYDKRFKKSGDWKRPSKTYILLKRGFANFELSNYKEAWNDLREVLQDVKGLKEIDVCWSDIFWRLGFISEHFREAESALKYYKSALNITPKCTVALIGIADVYLYQKKNCESALKIYTKFLDSLSNIGVDELSSRALLGRAYCLKYFNKWFAYRKCYKEAIKILKLVSYARDEVWIYVHLAVAYRGLKKFSKAEKYITLAEALAKKKGETFRLPLIFSK